jgi:hypothetical protein
MLHIAQDHWHSAGPIGQSLEPCRMTYRNNLSKIVDDKFSSQHLPNKIYKTGGYLMKKFCSAL